MSTQNRFFPRKVPKKDWIGIFLAEETNMKNYQSQKSVPYKASKKEDAKEAKGDQKEEKNMDATDNEKSDEKSDGSQENDQKNDSKEDQKSNQKSDQKSEIENEEKSEGKNDGTSDENANDDSIVEPVELKFTIPQTPGNFFFLVLVLVLFSGVCFGFGFWVVFGVLFWF